MRILCLVFPHLAIRVARRVLPAGCRPLILLAGAGDAAVVNECSREAAAAGVRVGMSAVAAQARCPGAAVLPGNAGACFDVLESAASILRSRATNAVAIAGREHLVIDLSGLEPLFADELGAATSLAALVRSWTGYPVRAAVADTRAAARTAARLARRGVTIAPECAAVDHISPWRDESLAAACSFSGDATAHDRRTRLLRLLGTLETILAARGESFRLASIEVETLDESRSCRVRSAEPLHCAADALALLAHQLPPGIFERATALTVRLGSLGPALNGDQEAELQAERAAPTGFAAAPVRMLQPHLLRAG